MSEEVLLSNVDLDLSGVSASRPMLDKVTARCTVGESGIEKKNGLRRVVIPLILEEPVKDTNGQDVHPGFRVTHSFLLDESGGWSAQRGAEEFLRAKMAILGVSESVAKSTPHDLTQFSGRPVLATFKVGVKAQKEGEDKTVEERSIQNVSRLSAIKS